MEWPNKKDFAFTIFDDTDWQTRENVREIYALLKDFGFRTTKSVWPVKGNEIPQIGGSTCEEPEYLKWVKCLQNDGFEIGYHSNTFHRSLRDEVIFGIEKFYEYFGHYPKTMAQHTDYRECEAIYWGNYRVTPGPHEWIYNIFTRGKHKKIFTGHIERSKYFWGDICKEKIKYVRNFIFSDINTIKACPIMPYHDPERLYVNFWFASSEGANVNSFNKCLSEKNQDRLEEEGGACIMYSHFASGFYSNGNINSRFQFLIKRLSKKNGWFVPASILLDYISKIRGNHIITNKERKQLERKWLLHKARIGST